MPETQKNPLTRIQIISMIICTLGLCNDCNMGSLRSNNGMVYPEMADAALGMGSSTPSGWMYNPFFLPHPAWMAIKTG